MSRAPAVAWLSQRKPVHGGAVGQASRCPARAGRGSRAGRRRPGAAGRLQTSSSIGAAVLADPHQAGPLRRPAGQGVEAVERRGAAVALQPAAELGELAVERQAAHMRADHGDRRGDPRRPPDRCRMAADGSWSCRAAAPSRAASARRRPAARARHAARAIRVMPKGRPSGRKPAGKASAEQAEEIHEVGVVAEIDVVEHRLALEVGQAIDRAGGRQHEEGEVRASRPRRAP